MCFIVYVCFITDTLTSHLCILTVTTGSLRTTRILLCPHVNRNSRPLFLISLFVISESMSLWKTVHRCPYDGDRSNIISGSRQFLVNECRLQQAANVPLKSPPSQWDVTSSSSGQEARTAVLIAEWVTVSSERVFFFFFKKLQYVHWPHGRVLGGRIEINTFSRSRLLKPFNFLTWAAHCERPKAISMYLFILIHPTMTSSKCGHVRILYYWGLARSMDSKWWRSVSGKKEVVLLFLSLG